MTPKITHVMVVEQRGDGSRTFPMRLEDFAKLFSSGVIEPTTEPAPWPEPCLMCSTDRVLVRHLLGGTCPNMATPQSSEESKR